MNAGLIERIRWIFALGFLVGIFDVPATLQAVGPKREYRAVWENREPDIDVDG